MYSAVHSENPMALCSSTMATTTVEMSLSQLSDSAIARTAAFASLGVDPGTVQGRRKRFLWRKNGILAPQRRLFWYREKELPLYQWIKTARDFWASSGIDFQE